MSEHEEREFRQLVYNLMLAIDSLNANISALTTAVSALPAPAVGGATEAQVQSAADAVAAQTARIVALETPPAVTPAPAPAN